MTLDYWFTKLSYRNDTTCIRSDNLDLIEQALIHIFEQKGCRCILQPPLPQNSTPVMRELRSRPWKIRPYLWVIGLFVGRLGWTIVKTSPVELLCRRARGANRPRLSELAIQSGCDAFHYRVHDRFWGALLEADASGRTFASGYLDSSIENMKFYDEPITEQTGGLRFFLLDVPEELRTVGRAGRVSINDEERQIRQEELEALFQQGGEEQVAYAWSEWKELNKSGFEGADEALGQLLGASSYYWHLDNLLYKVYAQPQQFAADRVRLLYFRPVGEPDVEEIWKTLSSSAQEDEDNIPW